MSVEKAEFARRRETMVDTQVRPSDVTKFPIIDAMLSVSRENFVPPDLREAAYLGDHLALSADRVLLDARTFGKLLDALDLQSTDLVLDVGCGLGYSSAILGHMTQAVVAVENADGLAQEAETLLGEAGVDNVAVVEADLISGAPQHGPYDAIFIQGGVETVPQALLDQLKDGGRIAAIFLDGQAGAAKIGTKSDAGVTWRWDFDAQAPLLPGFEKETAFTF